MFDEIEACTFARWSPKIGDPTVMGWVTVVAYAVAALLAFRAVLKAPRIYSDDTVALQRFFWISVTLLFLFLCVNKQLDLQSFMTAVGRCYSKINGWYDERREFQRHFIYGLMGVTFAAFVVLGIGLRRIVLTNWLAILGVFLVVLFILVRAVGFHHFDVVIQTTINDVKVNWILELGGITLVILGALWLPRGKKNKREAVYIDWSKQENESPGSGYSQ
ncbi:isopropylmalate isomerase [Hwanghaeella grinnelliae]|uniref:Isopropylmalate isomerase n=1 Tax=Hwanghaeella grinnelliae TaxID=2500179 RepID=A0A3S2ZCX6_9PROT|nr:isopropylmalate isomerase [Hwanghaeella grinnelliae]RVU39630.1 isopropylmalate isomerase [Hwanghaeella grinnelliae]